MKAALVVAGILASLAGFVYGYTHHTLLGMITGLQFAAAYGISLAYCLRIQADYPVHSTMRLAWQWVAASCAAAIVRHLYEGWAAIAHWGPERVTGILSLRQIPVALTLVFLSAGLIAMWSAFAALGLGTRFRRPDLVGASMLILCLPLFFSLRDGMSDAHSVYPLIRHIQSASPALLAAPALVSLLLHRISQEMGESTLSASLRLLAGSLVIRLAALLIGSSEWGRGVPLLAGVGGAMFWLSPWVFALGIYYRWSLTLSADSLANQYKTHPAGAIAELTIPGSD